MISNKLIRNTIVLFAMITILLIVPASFAAENITIDTNQEISAAEMENVLTDGETQKYDMVYVDANLGDDNGTGASDSPLRTISEGLNHANDGAAIYLKGTFSGDGNSNLTLEANPNAIAFIGLENAIVDGNYTNTFVAVNKGTYSFDSIAFVNHYKSGDIAEGGAISNIGGKLTFANCLFENNTVFGINKAHGGAIDNTGEITVTDCIFKSNVANITNSSGFRKNSADGGAISNLGTFNIYSSAFTENKVLRNGGAIRTQDGSKTLIDGCNFTGNVAAYHLSGGSYGGAIYTWDCGLELYNSRFENNRIYDASGYGARGGALSLNRGIGKIFIKSCEFINNTAGGITTVDGQSLYFESVEAVVNYCTIDTSIYSISQSTDLNWNWWGVNDTNINALIENLPSSAAVKNFAEVKISSDMDEVEIGKEVNVTIDLCWNGTGNHDKTNLIPLRTVKLDCIGGVLADKEGELIDGTFKTKFTPTSEDFMLIVNVGNVIFKSNLSETKEFEIKIAADDTIVGQPAIISIDSNNTKLDFCLIEINNVTYYVKLAKGNGKATVLGLNSGKHAADFKFYSKDFELINETGTTLTVNDKLDSKMNATFKESLDVNETLNINVKLAEKASGNIAVYLDGAEKVTAAIKKGNANVLLENITEGIHTIEVKYGGDTTFKEKSASSSIVVGNSKKDTVLEVEKSIATVACDAGAGEKGEYLYATLKDIDGKPLAGKTIQIALNGKIYDVTTNDTGVAGLQVSIASANTDTCTFSFAGDGKYNAAPLVCTKLTVSKKATSIKASAKAFKAKAKTKSVSVTLKTSKNKLDGKTYLSKGKKLTLKVKGKTYTAKTNSKGVAKFAIKLTKKGKFNALIKFAGDGTYKSSSKKIKITIK